MTHSSEEQGSRHCIAREQATLRPAVSQHPRACTRSTLAEALNHRLEALLRSLLSKVKLAISCGHGYCMGSVIVALL